MAGLIARIAARIALLIAAGAAGAQTPPPVKAYEINTRTEAADVCDKLGMGPGTRSERAFGQCLRDLKASGRAKPDI